MGQIIGGSGPQQPQTQAFPQGALVIGFVEVKKTSGAFSLPLPVGARVLCVSQGGETTGIISVLAEPNGEMEKVRFFAVVSGDAVPAAALGDVTFIGTFVGKNEKGGADLVHIFKQNSVIIHPTL